MAYARPVLCRLCGFPASDGGVPVSQVDREKLSEWCLRMMDTELDEEGLDEAVFCQFCVWQAKFLEENCDLSEKIRLPKWWKRCDIPRNTENDYKYLLDEVIQQCAVTIPLISKELLRKNGLFTGKGAQGRRFISNCFYCSAQLESRAALVRHVGEEHQNVLTYRCFHCNIFFLSKQEKDLHMQEMMHRRGLKLKCPYCSKHLCSKEYLSIHVNKEHNRNLICCTYKCSAYFANDKMRTEHIQEVHENEEKVSCIYCEKRFPKYYHLAHMKLHHKSTYIKCNFLKNCPTFFHTEEEREKHILEKHESGVERVLCIYCQRRILKRIFPFHVKAEHPKEMIKCHYFKCTTYFHTQEEKQRHILDMHESSKDKYKCIYCSNVVLNSATSIAQHMRNQHKSVAIKCDYKLHCPNYFLTQEEKQKHILEVHESGEDKIRCDFCPRMVKIKAMFDHRRIHHWSESRGLGIQSNKVKCIYCKSEFSKLYLSSHIKHNHKTEAIKCNFHKQCNSYFLTLEGRQKHIDQVHRNGHQVKLFKCCVCKTAVFFSSKYLKCHVNKHHPHQVKCKMLGCWEYFPSKQKVEEHYEKEHTMQDKGKLFKCSYCPFVAISRGERDAHYAEDHADATLQCPKCLKMLKSTLALRAHVRAAHGASKQCPYCHSLIISVSWFRHLKETFCKKCKSPFSCRGIRAKHPRRCI